MSLCPECGKEFECGMVEEQDGAPCWCAALPPSPIKGDISAGCYCPHCLKRRIEDEQQKRE